MLAVGLGLVLAACSDARSGGGSVAPTSATVPAERVRPAVVRAGVEAFNQTGDGTTVTVAEASIFGAKGWLIVHAEKQGGPDAVMGHVAIPEGRSRDVVVPLDTPVASGPYWVMVHRDAGLVDSFEWPGGPDGPVRAPAGVGYVQRKIELVVG